VEFVQYYLGLWGYPSPELYARKAEDGQGSRGLLLALAWTLSHHHILDVAVARQQVSERVSGASVACGARAAVCVGSLTIKVPNHSACSSKPSVGSWVSGFAAAGC